LIGSAGVSAVHMAAWVSQKLGAEADLQNMLLMHAMGPNAAGVIGSAANLRPWVFTRVYPGQLCTRWGKPCAREMFTPRARRLIILKS
jgi:hypothetical protein